jgi:hypothetical protein
MTAVLWAVVDRDGQFARGLDERPDRLYVTIPTSSEIANRDAAIWDVQVPSHAPHAVRALTWRAL